MKVIQNTNPSIDMHCLLDNVTNSFTANEPQKKLNLMENASLGPLM